MLFRSLAPAWMAAIIIGRDFAVTVVRSVAYARGIAMPARPLGKLKMAAQVVAILALILARDEWPGLSTVGQVALWVAVGAALASAIDYIRRFNRLQTPRIADLAPRRDQQPGRRAG